MRVDTNTKGHRQWYYFSVKNTNKQTIKLNIFRFKKKYSLYQRGMKPYVKSRKSGCDWGPGGQKVKYNEQKLNKLQNLNKIYQDSDQKVTYYLSFTYKFQYQNDQVFFAAGIPYTYTFLENRLSTFQKRSVENHQNLKFEISRLTKTTCGIPLPLIIIQKKPVKQTNSPRKSIAKEVQSKDQHQDLKQTNDTYNDLVTPRLQPDQEKQKKRQSKKRIIVINARSHSGQTSGSWVLDGFLQELTKSKAVADWIIQNNICIKIVPMLNPDGVFMGNYRTGIVGDDFNRKFMSGKKQYFPQIFGLKKLIADSKKQGIVELFLDLHGHSVLKNSFIFGPIDQMFRNFALKSLPQRLNDSSKYFRMENCKFRMEKDLVQTARIYFQVKQSLLSYTCQNSLGLYYNEMQTFQFLKKDYQSFGASILQSFIQLITERSPAIQNPQGLPQMNSIYTLQQKSKHSKILNENIKNTFMEKFNHSKNIQSSKQEKRNSNYANKISQKGSRKNRGNSQKRNPTQTQESQKKEKMSIEILNQNKKQKLFKISEKLPNLSRQFNERQKQLQSKTRKSRKSVQCKDEFLNQIIQSSKQQFLKKKSQSIKMGMFQMQQHPKRQFSRTRFTMKPSYKKKSQIYNALPQSIKNKLGQKPLKNEFDVSTRIYEQVSFQQYGRSITDNSGYLKKMSHQQQMKQLDEVSSSDQLDAIYQDFSQNYESINDLDSESDDLGDNQKKYILDHIKASRLNRRKSQEAQNDSQCSEEDKQYDEQINRQNSQMGPNINGFKEIKFKSVQPAQLSSINRTTFSVNKQNNFKKQKQINKFKDLSIKLTHQGIVEQQIEQQFVNIIQKKKISERPMMKTGVRQPYMLIKLKSSLPHRNKINFGAQYD